MISISAIICVPLGSFSLFVCMSTRLRVFYQMLNYMNENGAVSRQRNLKCAIFFHDSLYDREIETIELISWVIEFTFANSYDNSKYAI